MSNVNLDAQVSGADPDRWLSSRFVGDAQVRADLIALYAFETELLSVPRRVTQPLLAEMRYAWWREEIDGVFAGTARRGHPVLEALTAVVARDRDLPRGPFDALIDAHIDRVHGETHDLNAFYVQPMQTAVRILVGAGYDGAVADAGMVWGLSQVGRPEDAAALRPSANRALRQLPPAAFPAVAHATLKGPGGSEAGKRLRLTAAILRGRI